MTSGPAMGPDEILTEIRVPGVALAAGEPAGPAELAVAA